MYVECFTTTGCNLFYSIFAAKKVDNPDAALKEFQEVVQMEEEKGDW